MLIASPTTQYPQKLQLFGSASPRSLNTAADPFDRQPSLTLHSNIHARGMILTTLRMLLKITASSLFFADFIPIIHNLLGESWPSLRTPHDVKGKQKMDENKWTVIEATMSISLKALENLAAPFSSAVLERIVVRVGELYRFRLSGQDNGMNFDSQLMRMYSKLWERVVGSGIESNLRQTISTLILENSQKMVECLVNPESNSAELQVRVLNYISDVVLNIF